MSSKFSCQISLTILTGVLWTTDANAQALVQWAIVGGTTQTDALSSSALGPAGEIRAVGAFGYTDTQRFAESVLFKYDSKGQFISAQPARGDGINAVAVDANGNYFLTGIVRDGDTLGLGRGFDFYLGKYASNGSLLWERTAGTLNDSARSYSTDGQQGWEIALASDRGIYVAGSSLGAAVFGDTRFPKTPGGPLLCKYAPDGTLLWARRAEGKGLVFDGVQLGGGDAHFIALDPAGDVVISGSMTKGKATFDDIAINITGTYDHGAFAAKYSPTGRILWAKPIPYGAVAVDRQGNTFISGPTSNGQAYFDGTPVPVADPSGYKSFVAKFNPTGELLWVKAAPNGGLLADRQGNLYSGPAKFDPMGNLIWDRTVPGASLTVGILNDRDEPVFTGTIKGTVNLDGHVVQSDTDEYEDYVICKADVNGTFQWAFSVTSGNAEPRLAVGPFGFGIRRVLNGRNGDLFVFGEVRCPWSFAQQTYICDAVGKFGEFPVSVQAGGNNDFWLARISDPAPVPVTLKVARTATGLALSWSPSFSGFVLETASALPAPNWSAVPGTPSVVSDQNVITVEFGNISQFYRLRKP